MAKEQYEAEQLWLNEYIKYSTSVEISATAARQMAKANIMLPEIFDVLENGIVDWAERDSEYCEFTVIGRNCDEELIEVSGRFQSSTLLVAIDQVKK